MMYNIYISMKYIYAYMYRLYGGHYTALPQPVLPWLATLEWEELRLAGAITTSTALTLLMPASLEQAPQEPSRCG